MNFDDRIRQAAQKDDGKIPESFSERVDQTLQTLPSRPGRIGRWHRTLLSVAAVAALVVALPNVSASMADTMGALPVVGRLFQTVTFRTYEVEDGKNHISIDVPQVLDEMEGQGAQEINQEVTAYTNQLIEAYETEQHANGYFNLDVDWEIVTNTPTWFTLKISTDQVLASGNHQERYYHIDVTTGEQRTLSDLFPEDYDYVSVISNELKEQMRARMEADAREVYWLEGETQLGSFFFDEIDPNQNFYFDDTGKIVIPFGKYEVGPGSTGSPRFTLTTPELYENLRYQP